MLEAGQRFVRTGPHGFGNRIRWVRALAYRFKQCLASQTLRAYLHSILVKRANCLRPLVFLSAFGLLTCEAEEVFRDDFKGRLADSWSWIREDQSGWRVTDRGLEVRIQPGNMWGPANNATNVLVRPLPIVTNAAVEIAITVENRPTEQYEQADLVWYYDDSHMVKLGQELVDGRLSIVMGREEQDKTSTMAIIPIQSVVVHLRFVAKGNSIRGEYRLGDEKDWRVAGQCDLPANGLPKASLQVYQGPKAVERWARFTEFRIVKHTE